MGIFRRLSDIVTANVHDMLDKAENPEKMLKQIIRGMAGQKKLDDGDDIELELAKLKAQAKKGK